MSAALGLVLGVAGAAPALAAEPPFGPEPGSFSTELSTNQAGAHPDLRTRFNINQNEAGSSAGGTVKDLNIVLPEGLIGAPTATPTCPISVVVGGLREGCPPAAVGVANVKVFLAAANTVLAQNVPIYNVNPYPGEPAAFALAPLVPVRLDTYVRADGDYGVTATVTDLTEGGALLNVDVTLWGVPADHNGPGADTGQYNAENEPLSFGGPSGKPRIPFLTNPSECSGTPLTSSLSADSWQEPGIFTTPETYDLGQITGCDKPEFSSTIDAHPTTDLADAPSGLDFKLHLPQHDGPFVGADEVQMLEFFPFGEPLRLGFESDQTADLSLNPSADEIQSALEALPSIGAGNISVHRGHNNNNGDLFHYSFTFAGDLSHSDLAPLTAEGPFGATVTTLGDGRPGSPAEEIATAQLRDAVVKFPPGMTVNAASANGLEACSLAQAGISASGQSDGKAVNCPLPSKLGTVEAVSPAIDHPLGGALYLAAPNENPFGSLLALYLVVEDLKSGINVKLPGEVETDPNTGRLTVSFKQNPQLPIEDINLSLFKGNRAALKTPAACGKYTTTSVLTPWTSPAGADATPSSSFQLTKGPDGGACLPAGAAAPNSPTFSAGTLNPTAKAYSPFVLKLTRADGSQPLKSIDATLPQGLLAKLAGVPYCPDAALAAAANRSGKAEQTASSCPAASQVGSVSVGAGAGSDPFYASGKAYLAGPYKGAPLSLAIITPAVAGPFDLGTVVVRSALFIDPATAQPHAVSDPIPTILQGIPLDVRSIAVKLDKPDFTLNPTNCNPKSILAGATSVFDQTAALSKPFQVGDCAKLGFAPKIAIDLKGSTKRNRNPALTATVTYPKKGAYANIASALVTLPHGEFLDQSHIRTVCTRVQFAAKACPKGSIYGRARAITPLLDQPLEGPVYLRSSNNPLPDLVADLNGQIEVTLAGKVDTGASGGIRNTFQVIPDAPVTKFVLSMQGGKKGLLVNSENICRKPQRAVANFTAQNSAVLNTRPLITNDCKSKKSKGNGKKKAHK